MAVIQSTKYAGGKRTEVLSGGLRMEEAQNRLILFDGTDNRLIIGVAPDGNVVVALTKVGEDIFEAYNS